jgi:hypothetical protein
LLTEKVLGFLVSYLGNTPSGEGGNLELAQHGQASPSELKRTKANLGESFPFVIGDYHVYV